jgi:hypothetical protein
VPTDADQTETPDTDAPEAEAAEAVEAVEAPAAAPEAPAAPVAPVAKPAEPSKPNKSGRTFTDAERAARKERVVKAKDALARSVGMKGEHVTAARASLKTYLQRLNDPNQPDDARFERLIEAPFRTPPKKKTNDRRF